MLNPLDIEILTETFDDLPVGVGIFEVLDLNDIKSIRYVFMNKVVLYEMRKEREEVFGKKIIEVAPEAYEHEGGVLVMETYRKVAAEGGSINLGLVEYSNHMVAGTYECSVHHIRDNYVYIMLRNVTELESTKNDLENKNKELTQFAYIVSHDLKEPLNTISGFVQLIEDQYQKLFHQEAQELFSYISNATKRMARLITDLLDYSGIGQGKKLTCVDCDKLVEVVQQDLAIKIKETNTTFDIGKLPEVKGFETELRLLFQNLINNAIKFCKPGTSPKISIHAKEQDGWTFYIQDNGIGIADEHKDNIFSVFQRLHTTSEYEGTGIGLAHCKKIIELHKGDIGVISKEGEGSTFYFTIPDTL
ncbi:MAG: GHKL domain-containing protein [Balneola sp.]|nr:GHKL domain-containing protein [Balneola sp.]MBO6710222.1 GHKL domain-containing protein [Balneola sp.]MBO6798907.1 GHKL domain-containing protein [Balneola sp.]MBO6870021.1 GHKL domain-containing protein [Balneola sp.]